MSQPARPVCEVCHRPLEASDQYLVRFHTSRGTTVVHRSLCFPPPRAASVKQQSAATPA
jgi:hypothetical protein